MADAYTVATDDKVRQIALDRAWDALNNKVDQVWDGAAAEINRQKTEFAKGISETCNAVGDVIGGTVDWMTDQTKELGKGTVRLLGREVIAPIVELSVPVIKTIDSAHKLVADIDAGMEFAIYKQVNWTSTKAMEGLFSVEQFLFGTVAERNKDVLQKRGLLGKFEGMVGRWVDRGIEESSDLIDTAWEYRQNATDIRNRYGKSRRKRVQSANAAISVGEQLRQQ